MEGRAGGRARAGRQAGREEKEGSAWDEQKCRKREGGRERRGKRESGGGGGGDGGGGGGVERWACMLILSFC